MAHNDALSVDSTPNEKLPQKRGSLELTPSLEDEKSWLRVQRVLEQLSKKGCPTVKDACEAAGVARRTFYRDLHVPYVVQMWAERARSQDAVLWEIVDRSLAVVMMNMATIAMNNEGRDGVQAARLFYEMYNNLSAKAELLEEDDERSDALDFLKGFGSKATYRAKRKRRTKKGEVTEEIEVLSSGKPPHSESSPVIDA